MTEVWLYFSLKKGRPRSRAEVQPFTNSLSSPSSSVIPTPSQFTGAANFQTNSPQSKIYQLVSINLLSSPLHPVGSSTSVNLQSNKVASKICVAPSPISLLLYHANANLRLHHKRLWWVVRSTILELEVSSCTIISTWYSWQSVKFINYSRKRSNGP